MPFVIGEVEVVNEVALAPSAVLYDGATVADGDLSVKVNNFFYDLGGTKGYYLGSVGNAVADNNTNYVYLNSSAALVINTTGYPVGTHIRLARVIAAGGIIVRIVLERAFFTSAGSTAGFLTEAQHKTLRQLIHFIDNGPAEGFTTGAYRQTTGTVFPSAIVWYDQAGVGKKKIVEKLISYTGVNPTTITWKVYDAAETLLATVTDTISYSGVFETSRTRAIS